MEIEKLQSLSDEILDELLIVWEKSVRSSHHFLKEEDIEYFKPLIRNQYFPAVKLFVIRNENGRIAAFMGLSDDMLEMLFVLPEEQGHGYGKAFVDYAIDKCNIYKVDVNEDNEHGRIIIPSWNIGGNGISFTIITIIRRILTRIVPSAWIRSFLMPTVPSAR